MTIHIDIPRAKNGRLRGELIDKIGTPKFLSYGPNGYTLTYQFSNIKHAKSIIRKARKLGAIPIKENN